MLSMRLPYIRHLIPIFCHLFDIQSPLTCHLFVLALFLYGLPNKSANRFFWQRGLPFKASLLHSLKVVFFLLRLKKMITLKESLLKTHQQVTRVWFAKQDEITPEYFIGIKYDISVLSSMFPIQLHGCISRMREGRGSTKRWFLHRGSGWRAKKKRWTD